MRNVRFGNFLITNADLKELFGISDVENQSYSNCIKLQIHYPPKTRVKWLQITYKVVKSFTCHILSNNNKITDIKNNKCFIHPFFWSLVIFGDEVMKIRKYCVIFVYILQGKMGKTEKKLKENQASKVTKIPKNKIQKYGMNET